MTDVRLTCKATGECFYVGPAWGAMDALVNYYCDDYNTESRWDLYATCGKAAEDILSDEPESPAFSALELEVKTA